MQAIKLNKSQGASMFKAMEMALKPTEKLLQKQKVLLTHLTRNSYKSAEENLESGKAEKIKAAEEKKQTGFLYQLVIKNKILENTGKNTMKWLGKKWKWIAAAGLFLLPKSFWTGLKDLLNIAIAELPKIFKSIKDGTFLDDYGEKLGGIIGKGFALYLAGSAFKGIVLPALGTIFSAAISSMILKKTIKDTITKNLPAGVSKATPKITASPTSTMSTTPVSKASKVGKGMRLLPMLSAAGKIAGYAWAAYSLIDGIQTGLKEESFSAGFGQFWQTMWGGILGDKTQVQNLLNGVGDTILKASSAITKTFVKLATMDYKKKAKELWTPVQKQLDEKQKKKDERTRLRPADVASHTEQQEKYERDIAGLEKKIASQTLKISKTKGHKELTPLIKTLTHDKKTLSTNQDEYKKFMTGGPLRMVKHETRESSITGMKNSSRNKANIVAGLFAGGVDMTSGWRSKENNRQAMIDRATALGGDASGKGGYRLASKLSKEERNAPAGSKLREEAVDKLLAMPDFGGAHVHGNAMDIRYPKGFTKANFSQLKDIIVGTLPGAKVIAEKDHVHIAFNPAVSPMDKSNAFNAHQNKNNELTTPAGGGGNTTIVNNNITKKSDSSSMVVTAEPSANDPKNILNSTK